MMDGGGWRNVFGAGKNRSVCETFNCSGKAGNGRCDVRICES